MRISHRHRFIFFSNPKTGSESIRALLDPYSDVVGVPYRKRTPENPFYSHIRPVEVRELFEERGWNFEAYYRFTFVRNPWARLVSLYEMVFSTSAPRLLAWPPARTIREALGAHPSPAGFRRWLKGTTPEGIGGGGTVNRRWQRYGTYTLREFAGDEAGTLLVDQVIRLEDVDWALEPALARVGIPTPEQLKAPRVNARSHAHYATYYDDRSAALVAARYADEIASYDYRFGM